MPRQQSNTKKSGSPDFLNPQNLSKANLRLLLPDTPYNHFLCLKKMIIPTANANEALSIAPHPHRL